jgi:hypothetical protein
MPVSTPVVGPPPPAELMPSLSTKTLTIGGEHSTAFDPQGKQFDDGAMTNFGEGPGVYFGVGTRGLTRQSFGHLNLAVLDPQNLDTGNPPPPGSAEALNLGSQNGPTSYGPQVTLGWRFCQSLAIEATGFYLPQVSEVSAVAAPGRLDLPFFNPPLGFEGDNGLWLQADRVFLTTQSTVYSAEINFRLQPVSGCGLEWLFGVRYFDLRERFSLFTDDDGLTVFPFDPTRAATYQVDTHNRIVAPQIGVDWETPVTCWLAFGLYFKAAVGPDFLTSDVTLTRADGFGFPGGHRSETRVSQIYELGLYLDWFLADRIRVRGGWTGVWIVDVAVASDQINFDLSQTVGTSNNHGSIFYQGPIIEVHLAF